MLDKHSLKIDEAIVEIASYAHMPVEEVRDFIYLYLERQHKGQDNHKEFDDENMEGLFTSTAQELNIPIDELKTKIYDIVSKTFTVNSSK
jgi:hypothetical protein